jgi:hypothetical protein
MARILAEKSESSFAPSHSFCRCTTFWRGTALVFADLRDTEAALRWLQQAFEDRDVHMNFLLDHKWNKLRNNAHFRPMLPARSKVRSLTKAAKALRGTGSLEGACTNPQ